jgi:perosamine synthetase
LIPHSRPLIGLAEQAAVLKVLESGFVGVGGEEEKRFARSLAASVRRSAAIGVASGTAALEVALRVVGAAGGRVALPAFGCLSIERAVRRAGCQPSFFDVDRDHLSFPTGILAEASESCAAAVVVHQFGLPSPTVVEATPAMAVVEDFTTAAGGSVAGTAVGSFGRIGVLAMSATKLLCAGAGGALVGGVADIEVARAWIRPESALPRELPVPNAEMPEIAAALARVQLGRLHEFLERRLAIARHYLEWAGRLGLEAKVPAAGTAGTWWRFLIVAPRGQDPADIVDRARRRGVGFSRPLTREPPSGPHRFPVADGLHRTLISIPIYPALSDTEVEVVAQTIGAAVRSTVGVRR